MVRESIIDYQKIKFSTLNDIKELLYISNYFKKV